MIEISNLGMTYGGSGRRHARTVVFEDISLTVDRGDFVTLVGPSGCGKSTALLCIAGFEKPTSGQILLDGRPVLGPGPELGIVFQEYALFPWRSVTRNIEYGLEMRGVPARQRRRLASEVIELVGLTGFERFWPHQLSGGMRQRVAIARALVMEPDVLLLDEPFGALDAMTRKVLQRELVRIWDARQMTVLFVTHSISEAVYLSDRIILLSARPARIRLDVTSDLPRPRDPYDERFVALEAELERVLWECLEPRATGGNTG